MEKNDKSALRRLHLKKRDALTREQQLSKSHEIMESVVSSYDFQRAENVLIYASYGSEVDTKGIMEYALWLGKSVYCPRVTGDGEMEFYRICSYEQLKEGYKGIPEPLADETNCFLTRNDITDKEKTDTIVVIPGVCFDEKGHRIGYGKGFYDRYLKRIPGAVRMALAYDEQVETDIPFDENDMFYDLLVTESGTVNLI